MLTTAEEARRGTLKASAPWWVAVLALCVACASSATHTQARVEFDPPYFESVTDLTNASTLVVVGEVGQPGEFYEFASNSELPQDKDEGAGHGYQTWSFKVEAVVASAPGITAIPGAELLVGSFFGTVRDSGVGRDISAWASDLKVGERVVLFVDNFTFPNGGPSGWSLVGADYGVFAIVDAAQLAARAPLGPLAGASVALTDLEKAIESAKIGSNAGVPEGVSDPLPPTQE